MTTKNIWMIIIGLVLIAGGAYLYATSKVDLPANQELIEENGRYMAPDVEEAPEGELKPETFSGTLEEVNTGCFADGECYVVVDGRHVTTLIGWTQTTVGIIEGVEGFGDLETHIGEEVEVHAHSKEDGTYTLYGSESFYVRLK